MSNIDIIASVGKVGIENSSLSESHKELAKASVDIVTNLIKEYQKSSQPYLCMFGLNFELVNRIKVEALKYDIERVVCIPRPCNNGTIQAVIRTRGGNTEGFCHSIGIQPLPTESEYNNDSLDQLQKQYGIIIYDRIIDKEPTP